MNKDVISIAVDGPASAGKSTIAREVANRLKITYIDTGAMYRALTYKVLKDCINISNEKELEATLGNMNICFKDKQIYLDGCNISDEIRKNEVSRQVSSIARIRVVRDVLLKKQRAMANDESVIMDGRDIGTIVLPSADFKFFITASIEERAKRRFLELVEKGEKDISQEQIEQEISERDSKDSTREIAPLKMAEDAILIDTTNMSKEESIAKIINIVKSESNVL